MALTTYCALAEVRAVLGVHDEELSDEVLTLPIYEIGLVRELNKISSSLPGAFSTVAAVDEDVRTPAQQKFADAVRLFAAATVAVQAGAPLGMLAPRSVGDGKATLARFNDSPYRDALAHAKAMAEDFRQGLQEAFQELQGTTATNSLTRPARFTSAVGRSYDPVTGA